jgi:serine/threonine protein kinase/tetratricopeptide (TPR) repeat protein
VSEATNETLDASESLAGGSAIDDTVASGALDRAQDTESLGGGGDHPRGSTVGRYLVLDQLGAGAMGIVLAAYDPDLDRKVALKLLKPRTARDTESARSRLQREAQALAKLNHVNVVTVHDVGIHAGQVFVAMEFVDGETLGSWLAHSTDGRPRPWRDTLRVFDDAGQGLAAAHREGLVHRDFKPDNVMLGVDGRVRVMDFGLARAGGPAQSQVADLRDSELPVGESSALDTPLTQTGAVMGTPAYMAPEQFAGLEVTAKSDQFGFCVALFEAIYGQRPFEGGSFAALAYAVTEGKVKAPPQAGIPVWIYGVLLRGLAVDPNDRFPDMATLLDELGAGEARRKRQRALIVLGTLGLCALGIAGARHLDTARKTQQCETQGAEVLGLWSDPQRDKLRSSFLSSGVPYAEATVARVVSYLDDQAQRIAKAQTRACMDTRVRRSRGEDLLARSTWCLDEARMQLVAIATEFSAPDEKSIRKAITASSRLLPVAPCLDEHRLMRLPEPPRDAEAVAQIRSDLSRVAAHSAAGRHKPALELARSSLERAEQARWPPLTAQARSQVGALLRKTGELEEAEAILTDAYFEASSAGDLGNAIDASRELVQVVGYKAARYAEGRRWGRHAELAMALLGEPEESLRRAHLDTNLGMVENSAGEHARASELFESALASYQRVQGDAHPNVAMSLNNLAGIHYVTGDYAGAQERFERALAVHEQALGPEHPDLAASLNNLATVLTARGSYTEATPLLERALSIRRKSLGPEHASVAMTLTNIANVHNHTGNFTEAKAMYQQALAIYEVTLGPEHPNVADALNNLAAAHNKSGDHLEAKSLNERALAIREKALGADHTKVASSLNNLASVYLRLGEHEQARLHYLRALSIRERSLGPEHPKLAYSLDGLARSSLAQGRSDEALGFAERAVLVRESGKTPPALLADSRFILAKVLVRSPAKDATKKARARSLAKLALEAYREAESHEDAAGEVEAWLAASAGKKTDQPSR